MKYISPSILSADFARLGEAIEMLNQSEAEWIHVDVMDGVFVPNISFGFPVMEPLKRLARKPLDVHLMITEPIRYARRFCQAGADLVTVHLEADTPEKIHETLSQIREMGVKTGISVKPGTPAQALEPFLTEVDLILVMTVEPGFGGQKFMQDMMPKLRWLRDRLAQVNPGCLLEVDGGIDPNTAPIVKENGATVLVSGSAYFKAADKADFVRTLSR